jgi:hypothetical protein
MITPQFTYDKKGKKTGVFLSIEDWEQLEKIPAVGKIAQDDFIIPEWHKPLIDQALLSIENGTAELMEWEEAKKQFKL